PQGRNDSSLTFGQAAPKLSTSVRAMPSLKERNCASEAARAAAELPKSTPVAWVNRPREPPSRGSRPLMPKKLLTCLSRGWSTVFITTDVPKRLVPPNDGIAKPRSSTRAPREDLRGAAPCRVPPEVYLSAMTGLAPGGRNIERPLLISSTSCRNSSFVLDRSIWSWPPRP